MIVLYSGSGSQGFGVSAPSFPLEEWASIKRSVCQLLSKRRQDRAAELLNKYDFDIFEGTNDFNDEFSVLYYRATMDEYIKFEEHKEHKGDLLAFHQIAQTITEIGPFIRFIAVELKIEEPENRKTDSAQSTQSKVEPSKDQTDINPQPEWDVFICHASEDKEDFVRPLAHELNNKELKVWYDEFTLSLGDSLLRKIDEGLSRSRYGVVVLSPAFFGKDWPQKELDGLASKEVGGKKVILPVWHNVTREDVQRYSPILAGRVAAPTSRGLPYVVSEILKVVTGSSSTPESQDTSIVSIRSKLLSGQFLFESLWVWEDSEGVTIHCDVDGDGFDEEIYLGRNYPNGTRSRLIKDNIGYPMDIEGLDEDGFPKKGHYFHIALLDINCDSDPEILCAVGDGGIELNFSIWTFDRALWKSTPRGDYVNPMKQIGNLGGQSQAFVLPGAIIQIPYGSHGLYETYKWDGSEFKNITETG